METLQIALFHSHPILYSQVKPQLVLAPGHLQDLQGLTLHIHAMEFCPPYALAQHFSSVEYTGRPLGTGRSLMQTPLGQALV